MLTKFIDTIIDTDSFEQQCFIVPVSISFCHNQNDKNIDMTLNSISTNTRSYTNTSGVHKKPPGSIENEYLKSSKNDQNLITNVAVDNYAQSFETPRK